MPPPEEIDLGDKKIACWTYDQLARLSKANIRQRAMNLRDTIGAERLPPLRTMSQPETLMRWIIDVQVMLCKAVGIPDSDSDFGVPKEDGDAGAAAMNLGPPSTQQQAVDVSEMQPEYSADQQAAWGADRRAHEESLVVARKARMRNEGSFSFGAEPEPPPSAPPQAQTPPWLPTRGGRSEFNPMGAPMAHQAPPFNPMAPLNQAPEMPMDYQQAPPRHMPPPQHMQMAPPQPPPQAAPPPYMHPTSIGERAFENRDRPTTAFSDVSEVAASEATVNRLRNQGSFAFG